MPDFLIAYHVPANTGYAVELLEQTFFKVASQFTAKNGGSIHLGYSNYAAGEPRWLGEKKVPLLTIDYRTMSQEQSSQLEAYIKEHNIKYVLAFDLAIGDSICGTFRKAGISCVISYLGAPSSSLNRGIKLLLRRMQVMMTPNRPSHYIFESHGMRRTATHGRGILPSNTSVVKPGISMELYTHCMDKDYIYREFSIPENRKILFFAGHMEERKGVHIIVKAAAELINQRNRTDVHFLICGNRDGEKEVFDHLYQGTPSAQHITFGGYRNDVPQLMAGCFAGIIASTGWDSYPHTSMEMAASGLPLLVSDLIGLNETIEEGVTGFLFTPGNFSQLADKIEYLIANPAITAKLSKNAVQRIEQGFTSVIQEKALLEVIEQHAASRG